MMVTIIRKSLSYMIAIAMALTMFPLTSGLAYADGTYEDDDGLSITVSGDRLDVIVNAWDWSYNADISDDDEGDGDGEPEYHLNLQGETPPWAAEADAVKTIFVGEGTWWIGEQSFNRFTNLETIYLPKSLGGIGYDNGYGSVAGAFEGCASIKTIYYGGTEADWDKLVIDGDNGSLLSADVVYGKGYKDFTKATVSLNKKTFVWNTTAGYFGPNVTKVTLNSATLTHGTDYIVETAYKSNVGKSKIYCYGRNQYVGKKTRTFKVIPKRTSVKKVTSPSKKKIKVQWYKRSEKMSASRITGYQVRIATNKAFTKGVKTFYRVPGYKNTSKVYKVTKSHKRYYVKVRTYRTINGTTYWSNWSDPKSVISK